MHRRHEASGQVFRSITAVLSCLFILLSIVGVSSSAWAVNPDPIQYFFVPVTEPELIQWINGVNGGNVAGTTIRTIISITVTVDGTWIYYDNWEDGYEDDIANPTQTTTRIWGNGLAADGAPPGCLIDSCDVLTAGNVITLDNNIVTPRDTGLDPLPYDSQDKIASTELLVVSRAGYSTTVGTYIAASFNIFDTIRWGTYYRIPVGTNLTPAPGIGGNMFGYAAVSIMAQEDNTTVTVDSNADNVVEQTVVLNQGETLFVPGVYAGGYVRATANVQVDELTGQSPSNYQGRCFTLVPVDIWTGSYYTPMGHTTNQGTAAPDGNQKVFFYNPPENGAITITIEGGAGTVNVPSGGTASYNLANANGYHFYTAGGEPFFAVETVDSNSPSWDCGFSLIPAASLTTSVVAGWSPGNSDSPPTANVSPLWITPVAATNLYISYSGNPHFSDACPSGLRDPNGACYDLMVPLIARQMYKLFDPDNNQTGVRAYTVNGTRLAAVWAEDPDTATAGNATHLDMASTILPFPTLNAYKSAVLYADYNANGAMDPGDILTYTIRIHNSGIIPLNDIYVVDVLDPNTTYVVNTTLNGTTAIPDDAANTAFPLDADAGNPNGYLVRSRTRLPVADPDLLPGQDIYLNFQATINDPLVPPSTTLINNQVTVSCQGETIVNTELSPLQAGSLTVTKTPVPADGQTVLPGATIPYTVTITNTSTRAQTGVAITDALPAGSTFVANSTSVTGPYEAVYRDKFDAVAYTNSDGTSDWSGNAWTETTDAAGIGPGVGNIQIKNGALRMRVTNSEIRRPVNLAPAAGYYTFAYLSLDFHTSAGTVATNVANIEVWNGAAMTTLESITGLAGVNSGARAYDLTPFMNAATQIRVRLTNYSTAGAYFYVDDLQIHAVGTVRTVLDQFSNRLYTNNNGTVNWKTNWVETNDDNSWTAGRIYVTNPAAALQMQARGAATAPSIVRTLDASALAGSLGKAFLSFNWYTAGADAGQDYAVVEASAGGAGGTFTTVGTLLPNNIAAPGTVQRYDITPYISANTAIRFRISDPANAFTGNGEWGYFDNVQVTWGGLKSTTKNMSLAVPSRLYSGTPPTITSGTRGDDFALGAAGSGFETVTATYNVRVNDPADATRVVNTVSATTYERAPTAAKTVINPIFPGGAMGDLVWLDSNRDGVLNPGEPGLANITLTLYSAVNGVCGDGDDVSTGKTALTSTDGSFLIDAIMPGTYCLRITAGLPGGLTQTFAPTQPRTVTLAGEERFLDVDFGYGSSPAAAIIGDYVWSDANGNGIQDPGEAGINGVTVDLITRGPDNLWATADDVVWATTSTAVDGHYLFTGVDPGNSPYAVHVTDTGGKLVGYTATLGPQSPGDVYNGPLTVIAGQSLTTADFGFRNPANISISDRVWFDTNGNGVLDSGEPGIEGVTVNLLSATGAVKASNVSDINGDFDFSGLPTGVNYTIVMTDADGKLIGYAGTTSYAVAGQKVITAPVANVTGTSFGYNRAGYIGDQIWSDSNANGIQDPGEVGVSAITVTLWRDVDGNGSFDPPGYGTGLDTQVDTTVTDSAGRYGFQVSSAGRYFVSVDETQAKISGWTLTTADDSGAPGVQRMLHFLNLSQSFLTADFGFQNPTRVNVSGTVYQDDNQNATHDTGESMLNDISLNLMGPGTDGVIGTADDELVATVSTAAGGTFTFPNVSDGIYRIEVTDTLGLLAGYTQTAPAPTKVRVNVVAGVISYPDGNLPDFGFYISPTLAEVRGLSAVVESGVVVVRWETVFEHGTAGFRLERFDGAKRIEVNRGLVPALFGSPLGGNYALTDPTAPTAGFLTYYLVEVEHNGHQRTFGPYNVKVKSSRPGPLVASRGASLEGTAFLRLPRPADVEKMGAAVEATDDLSAAALDAPARARIAVKADGFRAVGAAQIASVLGVSRNDVLTLLKSHALRLSCAGQPVPWLALNDRLVFYGRGIESLYTDTNVYWLEAAAGQAVKRRKVAASAIVSPSRTFSHNAHFETDTIAAPALAATPEDDYWFWDFLSAGDAGYDRQDHLFDLPGLAGNAVLKVTLQGGTTTGWPDEHHLKLTMNGISVGEFHFTGTRRVTASFNVPHGILKPQGNTLGVTALLDEKIPWSLVFVDSFDVTYARSFRAVKDLLVFGAGKARQVTVRGFSAPGILLFDLTDPALPVRLTGFETTKVGGAYALSFAPPRAGRTYAALLPGRLAPVDGIARGAVATLKDPANAADYLIVTDESLRDSLAPLIAHRQGEGLAVQVATVRGIMDEFNYGIHEPRAIGDFVRYAAANWSTKPSYLLLAGDGSYDYRDLLGYGGNIVPPLLILTDEGIAPADGVFGDVDGDRVPEVAVGRLPAQDATQLETMIDKIIGYENGSASAWREHALLLADNGEGTANDFPADSDAIGEMIDPVWSVGKIYLSDHAVEVARPLLFSALDEGRGMVSYVGHGGPVQLADEGLLLGTDVATLTNGSKLPVLTGFTCALAEFSIPGYRTLAESLLDSGLGGAVAVWSSTSLSHNHSSVELGKEFYRRATASGGVRIGDLIGASVQAFVDHGENPLVSDAYTLLGDPALKLNAGSGR